VSPASLLRLQLSVLVTALAVVGAALVVPMWRAMPRLRDRADAEIAVYDYPPAGAAACAAGSRPGAAGESPSEETAAQVRYLVKTPANYDATRAHPLLVVYSPNGANRFLTERFVGLTRLATAAGFVVAYADSRPLAMTTIADLGAIPERIAARWCIDVQRIYLTGHSDGGTVATAIAVLGKSQHPPAAIAPSAAGFRREDLAAYPCPAPLRVMVLHNRDDDHFPGYGAEAAQWWAACDGCGAVPAQRADGCLEYPSCKPGSATVYCEGEGGHAAWPDRNQTILEFLKGTL